MPGHQAGTMTDGCAHVQRQESLTSWMRNRSVSCLMSGLNAESAGGSSSVLDWADSDALQKVAVAPRLQACLCSCRLVDGKDSPQCSDKSGIRCPVLRRRIRRAAEHLLLGNVAVGMLPLSCIGQLQVAMLRCCEGLHACVRTD